MSKYRKHIDDFFREKLGRYRETPPADVWESLDKRLDGLAPSVPGASYRWMLHVGIVSLIMVLAVSLVKKMTGNSDSVIAANNQAVSQSAPTAAPVNNTNEPAANTATTNKETANNNGEATNDPQTNESAGATTNNGNKANTGNKTANNHKTHIAKNTNNRQQAKNNGFGQATENNYNAGIASRETKEEYTADNGKGGPSANLTTDGPVAAKKEPAVTPAVNKTIAPKTVAAAETFNRFEAGVKVGFERGLNDQSAQKYVVTPYLQYNLSKKFAIMTQPSVKAATIGSRNIGTSQNFYSVDPNQKITNVSNRDSTYYSGGVHDKLGTTATYDYTQYHDSIVKSYTYGGTYLEFEIPILAKYNITKTFSAYGGVNIIYSRLVNVTEHTYTSQPIGKAVGTKDEYTPLGEPTVAPPSSMPVNADATPPGNPISSYNGPMYASPAASIRVGYMAGFSYEYTQRWLFDALIQQAPIKSDVQGGYNMNTTLSSTYLRLSVGYKLTK
jgi:hypothetical protein